MTPIEVFEFSGIWQQASGEHRHDRQRDLIFFEKGMTVTREVIRARMGFHDMRVHRLSDGRICAFSPSSMGRRDLEASTDLKRVVNEPVFVCLREVYTGTID